LAIKAKWKITTENKKYEPGDIISDLGAKEETRLIQLGAAEKVTKKPDKNA
jgi:hypothetical protein